MKTNNKASNSKAGRTSKLQKDHKLPLSVLKAVAIGAAIALLLMMVCSFIVKKFGMPFSVFNMMSIFCLIAGCFISGFYIAKTIKEKGMILGALCGACIFILVLAISCLNSCEFGIAMVIKLAICMISGAIGGIIGINKKNPRKI